MKKRREHIIDDIHMTPDVTYIQNPDVSHEASDVNVRSIIIFAGGLLVFGVIVHVLMWLMFQYMEDRARKEDPPPKPMALTEQERLPPKGVPRLQAAPGFGIELGEGKPPINLQLREPQAEYNELKKIWDAELAGKPDPRTGMTSMPIEQAMQKAIEDGQLKTRAPAEGQQKIDMQGMEIPSYQSSGRMREKRDQ